MKPLQIWLSLLTTALIFNGCDTTIHVNKPTNNPTTPSTPEVTSVRLLIRVNADFPEGTIPVHMITMDGQPIHDGSFIRSGLHKFLLQTSGYDQKEITIDIPPGLVEYTLETTMEASLRLVRFDFRDAKTNQIINPDRVEISSPKGITHQIDDQSLVKPGSWTLLVFKTGYKTISINITIETKAGEPYILAAAMEPGS